MAESTGLEGAVPEQALAGAKVMAPALVTVDARGQRQGMAGASGLGTQRAARR